jgi:hypothetical protein
MKPLVVSLAVLAAPHVGHAVVSKRGIDELSPQLRPQYADGATVSVNAPRGLAAYESSSDRRVRALVRTARSIRFDNGGVGLMLDFHW